MLNPIEQTYRELNSQGEKILKLYSGNPNDQGIFFPSEILSKAYQRYFDHPHYQPHPKGLLTARQAIADYYATQQVSLNPDQILLTSGTSESFFYLFSLLTESGDHILAPNPSYPLFDYIAELTHITLKPYSLLPEKNWSLDLDEIRQKTNDRTKAIVLISPHNPTGATFAADQIRALVEFANEKEIPLICDEVFSEFYFEEDMFPRVIRVAQPNLCFTLNGLSKMFALPALKLSWIAVTGEPSLTEPAIDRLETIADTFLSTHTPIQQALPTLFEKGKEFLKYYQAQVRARREIALQSLHSIPTLQFIKPVGGFYLMAKVLDPHGLSEEEWAIELMRQKKLFVHPGYFFDYEDGVHFVISFLTEPAVLEEGLRRVREFVGGG